MKLVSYNTGSEIRAGVLVEEVVYDLQKAAQGSSWLGTGQITTVKKFIEDFGKQLSVVSANIEQSIAQNPDSKVGPVGQVTLAAPLAEPSKVLCIGLNYKDHVAETGRSLPEYPDVFAKFASTLIGPSQDIGGADVSDNLDFEGELAVIIGQTASKVTDADALNYVAGYSILNDITARNLQYRGTQWLAGKAVDRSTPWGPSIVTADEVGDPQTLELVTRVNTNEMQRSNTKHQIFPVAQIISYLSGFLTLSPGDIIATGTPQGIGAKRTPPVWLNPGDVVEIEIDRIGLLRNTVAKG